MDFTDFFYADIFLNFLWQMSVYLAGYAKRLDPTVLLARRRLNAILLTLSTKIFKYLNYISNIFQETLDFLVFTELIVS